MCIAVQVDACQLTKENIERSCCDNIDAAERRTELREAELNKLIIGLEAKHGTHDVCHVIASLVTLLSCWQ